MVVPPPTEKPLRRRARPGAPRVAAAAAAAASFAPAPAPALAPETASGAETARGDVAPAGTGPSGSSRPSAAEPGTSPSGGADARSRLVVLLAVLALAGLIAGAVAWASGDRSGGIGASPDPEAEATVSTGPAAAPPPAAPSSSLVPGSVVTVSASQSTVIVAGAVPSQAIAEELVGRASAVYTPDQVQNQLAADPATRSPIVVVVNGATTDPALFNRLTSAFTGIVGIDTIELAGLRLDEPSELEGALMALPSIQFAPATAEMLPESLPVLDQMTALLAAAPGTAVEIGVHTDTRGSAEANRALSQARADAVLAALTERGVANPLAARGFGESRPVAVPDDTPLTQEVNRRVELRVL